MVTEKGSPGLIETEAGEATKLACEKTEPVKHKKAQKRIKESPLPTGREDQEVLPKG